MKKIQKIKFSDFSFCSLSREQVSDLNPVDPEPIVGRFYLVPASGVHCAEAIFHLPDLCTNTTVVASFEFSLADLVVRLPVRIAVSPNRRTDTSLNVRSGESRFGCVPALAVVFGHIPIGATSVRLSISIWSIVVPSPLSKALNHLACKGSSSERRLASVPWATRGAEHRRVTKMRIAECI
jgi:hypothetical protein